MLNFNENLVVVPVLVLALGGCAMDTEAASASVEPLLDVNVELILADGGDDDGSIPWEILQTEFTGSDGSNIMGEIAQAHHTAGGGDGGEDDGSIPWEILQTEITQSSTGQLLCVIFDGVLYDAATGRALLEARHDGIYEIRARMPSYTFVGDEVLRGDGSRVLITSPEQQSATDRRKLVIAALAGGHCGSNGI